MNRFKASFRSKNRTHLTPEQQLNQYVAPPQIHAEKKTTPKPEQDTEVDEEQQRRQLNSSTEYVRRVRELVREKYRLDVYVWSKRNTLECNRQLIMNSCKRSDEILHELYSIVYGWDRDLFNCEEWAVVLQIKAGVVQCTREDPWQAVPPWYRPASGRASVGPL